MNKEFMINPYINGYIDRNSVSHDGSENDYSFQIGKPKFKSITAKPPLLDLLEPDLRKFSSEDFNFEQGNLAKQVLPSPKSSISIVPLKPPTKSTSQIPAHLKILAQLQFTPQALPPPSWTPGTKVEKAIPTRRKPSNPCPSPAVLSRLQPAPPVATAAAGTPRSVSTALATSDGHTEHKLPRRTTITEEPHHIGPLHAPLVDSAGIWGSAVTRTPKKDLLATAPYHSGLGGLKATADIQTLLEDFREEKIHFLEEGGYSWDRLLRLHPLMRVMWRVHKSEFFAASGVQTPLFGSHRGQASHDILTGTQQRRKLNGIGHRTFMHLMFCLLRHSEQHERVFFCKDGYCFVPCHMSGSKSTKPRSTQSLGKRNMANPAFSCCVPVESLFPDVWPDPPISQFSNAWFEFLEANWTYFHSKEWICRERQDTSRRLVYKLPGLGACVSVHRHKALKLELQARAEMGLKADQILELIGGRMHQ